LTIAFDEDDVEAFLAVVLDFVTNPGGFGDLMAPRNRRASGHGKRDDRGN
jgi:hypothetical protein